MINKKNIFKKIFSPFWIIIFIFYSCNHAAQRTDTPTTGEIIIYADETFKPFIESEKNVFEGIYKFTKINVIYKPELEVFDAMIKDTTRLIVVARPLNQNEKEYFKSKRFFPKEIKIATDGIAIILNKNNNDTM